jgi:multidrug efflux pump subunit AcrA (membrane-fusion protein)
MPGRSFILTYIVPAVGLMAFGFGTITVLGSTPSRAAEEPTFAPPTQPAALRGAARIGAVGIIEPEGEAIAIGAHRAGVVEEVLVRVGDVVEPGTPLFRVDRRLANETVSFQRAQLHREEARLAELRQQVRVVEASLRRAEARLLASEADELAAVATLRSTEAEAADRRQRAARSQSLLENGSIAEEEADSQRLQADRADALVASAQANLGAARAAVAATRAEVEQLRVELEQLTDTSTNPATDGPLIVAQQAIVDAARASLRTAEVELDYLTVTAPRRATILQVNIRPGEYVAPGLSTVDPIIIGNVDPLHVRVRIDESDALRFKADAPATASPRGDATREIPLRFVRIEPLLVPKRSLSGASTEFVDTQVMEVIFALEGGEGLLTGMRMDVSLAANP